MTRHAVGFEITTFSFRTSSPDPRPDSVSADPLSPCRDFDSNHCLCLLSGDRRTVSCCRCSTSVKYPNQFQFSPICRVSE